MARQLTILERERIAQFLSQGLSQAEIARRLGRSPSTISRELTRNRDGATYWSSVAHEKAQARRQRRPRKLDDPSLLASVRRGLVSYWSPEQIAGRSRRDFPHQPRRQLSHMTIYRWLAEPEQRGSWRTFLRFGRRRPLPETRGKLKARAEIRDRPGVVDERRRFGDWEGDTVIGQARRGALVTLVERKSGFAVAGQVHRLKARNVARVMTRRFAILPPGLRRTLTLDNGKEFARHQQVAHATGIDTYFARPYHAWERGANESFNGLVRQFFPKGTDLAGTSPRDVKDVLDLQNHRPLTRLGYRTPREALGRYYPVAFEM
jgi:IS30 family transposase